MDMSQNGPLAGLTVIERAETVAAAYAGRLFSVMGAEVIMVEPPTGSSLRREPPFLPGDPVTSALFAYLAAGKQSVVCDSQQAADRRQLDALLERADVFVDDTPVDRRHADGTSHELLLERFPLLVVVSVLPFGASGPRAGWQAHEINALHAGGEGYLLPNGLSIELFPDRPPLKVYGHFASLQGGVMAAAGAIAALITRPWTKGQCVDVSVQDANVAESAFALQRFGEGVLENRSTRSFRYGGVVECADGFVQILTLESHQWSALVELMGRPAWATSGAFDEPLARSRRGADVNRHLREWARTQCVADVVARGQAFGVPVAKYNTPADVLSDPHERARGLFAPVAIADLGELDMLVAPFQFSATPTAVRRGPPALGMHRQRFPESLDHELAQPRSAVHE